MSPTMHTLIKEIDTDYAAWQPDAAVEYRYRIECADPASCDGWIECGEEHEVEGRSADAYDEGPFDCAPDAPWFGAEKFEFHGAMHTWRDGYGWTKPFDGCIVAYTDWDVPDEAWSGPVGRYPVDDEWDDTSCTLSVCAEVTVAQPDSVGEARQ